MKAYELSTKRKFFESFGSIRTKRDIILLLLEILKTFIIDNQNIRKFNDLDIIDNDTDISIVIYIDKMKRIFYCTKNKVQSFCFPFTIIKEDDEIKFYFKNEEIDLKCISILIRIFSSSMMDNSLNLIELLLNDEVYSSSSENYQNFLEELLIFISVFEDGYLRFDFNDEKNENEEYHPLHHIDFYYTNSNTFKLGIIKKISLKNSIEIIDINKECLRIN